MSRFEDICEEIDAFVFTGDGLFDFETRETFKELLARWGRGVAEVESSIENFEEDDGEY